MVGERRGCRSQDARESHDRLPNPYMAGLFKENMYYNDGSHGF
jgi:hypothetical protein